MKLEEDSAGKTKNWTKPVNTTGLTRPVGVQAHVLTEGDGERVSELMVGCGLSGWCEGGGRGEGGLGGGLHSRQTSWLPCQPDTERSISFYRLSTLLANHKAQVTSAGRLQLAA